MSLEQEKRAVDALGQATWALIQAAADLALADRYNEAKAANAAAKEANRECAAICDAILSRWWVRPIIRIGDWLTRREPLAFKAEQE